VILELFAAPAARPHLLALRNVASFDTEKPTAGQIESAANRAKAKKLQQIAHLHTMGMLGPGLRGGAELGL
jgi:hypothetical protein